MPRVEETGPELGERGPSRGLGGSEGGVMWGPAGRGGSCHFIKCCRTPLKALKQRSDRA